MSLIRSSHIRLAGAALLAVIIPWWWMGGGSADEVLVIPYQGRAPRLETPPPVPEQALAGRLFFGPIDVQNPVDGMAQGPDPTAAPSPPIPTLLGTATSRRGRAVILLKLASGETRLASRGESIDGWTITRIGEGAATVTNAGVTRTLELPRSTAAASPAALPSVR